jgi:hypothetical protein
MRNTLAIFHLIFLLGFKNEPPFRPKFQLLMYGHILLTPLPSSKTWNRRFVTTSKLNWILLKKSVSDLKCYCSLFFPRFKFQILFALLGSYDNGLNNIAPTLITMTKVVQNAFVQTCKAELSGTLHFQQAVDGVKVNSIALLPPH